MTSTNLPDALGIRRNEKPRIQPRSWLDGYNAQRNGGPIIFVAKPARDMVGSHRTLVCELQGRGYRVTPDPDKHVDELGDLPIVIAGALAEAIASIHLLGQSKGGRPDGCDMDLAPMQLAAAAGKAKTKPGFVRLLWAPSILPFGAYADVEGPRPDALSIVDRFGEQLPSGPLIVTFVALLVPATFIAMWWLRRKVTFPAGGTTLSVSSAVQTNRSAHL